MGISISLVLTAICSIRLVLTAARFLVVAGGNIGAIITTSVAKPKVYRSICVHYELQVDRITICTALNLEVDRTAICACMHTST